MKELKTGAAWSDLFKKELLFLLFLVNKIKTFFFFFWYHSKSSIQAKKRVKSKCDVTDFSWEPVIHPPLSESDLSEDMVDPWLLFLILSVPLWSCSSRTCSSLCSQRRRSFSCSARSSCSCSFWNVADEGERDIWSKLQTQRGRKGMLLERSMWGFPKYLYVKLSLSQQVQGGVPHGVGRVRNLLLQLLQALPELSSSADYNNQQCYFFISRHITTTAFKGASTELCYRPTQCDCEVKWMKIHVVFSFTLQSLLCICIHSTLPWQP